MVVATIDWLPLPRGSTLLSQQRLRAFFHASAIRGRYRSEFYPSAHPDTLSTLLQTLSISLSFFQSSFFNFLFFSTTFFRLIVIISLFNTSYLAWLKNYIIIFYIRFFEKNSQLLQFFRYTLFLIIFIIFNKTFIHFIQYKWIYHFHNFWHLRTISTVTRWFFCRLRLRIVDFIFSLYLFYLSFSITIFKLFFIFLSFVHSTNNRSLKTKKSLSLSLFFLASCFLPSLPPSLSFSLSLFLSFSFIHWTITRIKSTMLTVFDTNEKIILLI